MVRRRSMLAALGWFALAAPLRAFAQPQGKLWRIGALTGGSASTTRHIIFDGFFKGMADLGYQEGRNVHYELRYGEGSNAKLDLHAREFTRDKVDLIWASSTAAATAAQRATASIPIVFATVGDPVYSKLVRSLASPGTNATGMSVMTAEMSAKRVEILNDIFPKVRRIGVLYHPDDTASTAKIPFVQSSARALDKELLVVEARAPEEFAAAFAQLKRWRAQALLILESSLFFNHRQALIDTAVKNRWPTVNSTREYAEAGGVVSYGADYVDNCRRSAVYVDKILKGAKPAALPVQQPVKFEFVINLKSAKTMGLKIPQSVLLRADRVIE